MIPVRYNLPAQIRFRLRPNILIYEKSLNANELLKKLLSLSLSLSCGAHISTRSCFSNIAHCFSFLQQFLFTIALKAVALFRLSSCYYPLPVGGLS